MCGSRGMLLRVGTVVPLSLLATLAFGVVLGEHNRKLSARAVQKIGLLEAAGHKQRDIARRFGVSQHTVWSIARGIQRLKG
jgi:hypothetical protein